MHIFVIIFKTSTIFLIISHMRMFAMVLSMWCDLEGKHFVIVLTPIFTEANDPTVFSLLRFTSKV